MQHVKHVGGMQHFVKTGSVCDQDDERVNQDLTETIQGSAKLAGLLDLDTC